MRHDLLDWQYHGISGLLQKAGHRVIHRWSKRFAEKIVVEVGCGHGHHLRYGIYPYQRYIGLDIEHRFLQTFRSRFSNPLLVQGDAYILPFRDQSADCVISIYNFEHLKLLSDCLSEIRRVLKPQGELLIGIPMEGGLIYGIGRVLTSKRYMEKKYRIDYNAIVQWEHCNQYMEIEKILQKNFHIEERFFIPFPFLPFHHLNVIQCMRTRPFAQ